MALEKQVLTIDLGFGGLDQKTDPKRVVPTRLTDALNVRYDKAGRISRRYGYDVNGSCSTTFTRILNSHDGLVAVQSSTASMNTTWLRNTTGWTTNQAATQKNLPVPEVRYHSCVVPDSYVSNFYAVDAAVGENYTLFVAVTQPQSSTNSFNGTITAFAVSNTTHKLVAQYSTIAGANPRVLCLSGDSFVVGHNGAVTTSLRFRTINVLTNSEVSSSLSVTVPVTGTVWSSLPSWDWGLVGSSIYLAACANANTVTGVGQVTTTVYAKYTPDSSVSQTSINHAEALAHVGVATRSNGFVSVLGIGGPGFRYTVMNTSLTLQTTGTIVYGSAFHRITVASDSGETNVVVVGDNLSTGNIYQTQVSLTNGGVGSPTNSTLTAAGEVMSKVIWGSLPEPLFWFSCGQTIATTSFLMGAGSSYKTYARAIHGEAYWNRAITSYPSEAAPMMNQSGSLITCAALRLNQLSAFNPLSYDPTKYYGAGLLEVSTDQSKYVTGLVDNQAHVSGGLLSCIESPGIVNESGALTFLRNQSSFSAQNTSGGLISITGTVSIYAVMERYDQRGERVQSALSRPSSVNVTGTQNSILITDDNEYWPAMTGDWRKVFYMTQPGGSVYYRVDNSVNSRVLTINSASEPLYTTGGILENWQPSCPIAFATNGRRAICVQGDNPNFVMVSKEKRPRYALAWMEDVGRYINSYGPAIVDLKCLNDKWIAFKERAIFAATGEGPDDTGQNDSLSEFEPVSTSVGCANRRASVLTNYGIIFLSERGFYLLDPGLGVQFIGAAVSDVDPTTVQYGTYLEKSNEVYFKLSNDTALVLTIFETEQGVEFRWSRNENAPFHDMSVLDGTLSASLKTPTASMSVVNQSTTFYDNQSATYQPYVVQTAWIPMGNIQGFGRLYEALFIGTAVTTNFTARVDVAYDYEDFNESHTITGANSTLGSSVAQFRVQPTRQKCESVRFKFTMTSDYEGMQLNQIQMVVGIKGGANKMRAGKQAI